jgi:hypothetical protein
MTNFVYPANGENLTILRIQNKKKIRRAQALSLRHKVYLLEMRRSYSRAKPGYNLPASNNTNKTTTTRPRPPLG